MNEARNSKGNSNRRRHADDDGGETSVYKSKNLIAERKRRQKLSDRQLELRALVPHITNAITQFLSKFLHFNLQFTRLMNKATIITDAIAYIEELQKTVRDLSNQLFEMEATFVEEPKTSIEAIDAAEEMKNWGIEPEIKVNKIDGYKLWIKIVFEKKRGGFTKLMEAVSVIGYEFTDINVTTSRGAILVTACLEGNDGSILEAEQIREMLLEIMRDL